MLGLLLIRRPDQVWISYVVVAAVVSLTAFFEPARSASIPNLTARGELIVANALGAVTWSVSLGLGSALGGLVTAVAGWRAAFVLDAASFFCSAWLIGGVVLPRRGAAGAARVGWAALLGVSDLVEGVRYLRRHPAVAATVLVKAGWSLAGGVDPPAQHLRRAHLSGLGNAAAGIGLLAMARGVGTALGPVVVAAPVRHRAGADGARHPAGFFVAGGLYLVFAAVHHCPSRCSCSPSRTWAAAPSGCSAPRCCSSWCRTRCAGACSPPSWR